MRLVIALVVVWLIVGVAATVQRGYFKGNNATCAKTGNGHRHRISRAFELRRCQPEAQLPPPEAVEGAENRFGFPAFTTGPAWDGAKLGWPDLGGVTAAYESLTPVASRIVDGGV